MKKLIVLSAVVLTTALTLTSCDKKETKVETETEVIETPADTVAQPEAVAPETVAPATTTDTVTEKK